ncbi:UDP-N-acetylmuramate--L-alanine ligase [Coxiella endosymbiont of Amblyomma americanum]|uniref:UDP-N-acetylmuramate--L-alanine ligase n=1 Tax=Coxiella endosymbiont of Amblyomma americanum TaxID=325775 RepID=UPI0005808C10|nr:UDP-N-acetylmuramate--L-alanine ligase [Coxiella endosymbiont of Amblyomma americanum]AJC50395.1 UDP-N-acetylmuramate--alanine ligase [Coxiella endosymbiont of Amblyomma americanum]AUJ58736.1 UDP-N-acetylmuramate--L-alanine ligase [Coxiella-like endosymbiont of Amblyomma americanum]
MILGGKIVKSIHCVGIGGIGISALAEILLKKGYRISGSDIAPNKNTERLCRLGADITFHHNSNAIIKADCAVYSSAISLNNPECVAAQQINIPLLKRGQMLSKMTKSYQSIAVSGSHGKTTTSALLSKVFITAGLDPTCVIGGFLKDIQVSARLGSGPYFIAEVDESDASLLYMRPNIGIITNIDSDHLSTYEGDFNLLKKTYVEFIHQISKEGVVILCIDDPILNELIPTLSKRVITYGFSLKADYRADYYLQRGLRSYFRVYRSSKDRALPLSVEINLVGYHNVLNTLAVIAVSEWIGIDEKKLLQSLMQFSGVERRFDVKGNMLLSNGQAIIVEDYGHHPNEIRATLSAARAVWPDGRRVVLVFQPHRYSRTQVLLNDFASVLIESDLLILLEVYSAGEAFLPKADGKTLLKVIRSKTDKKIFFVSELRDLPSMLRKLVRPNDVIILQGAGNIGSIAVDLIRSS